MYRENIHILIMISALGIVFLTLTVIIILVSAGALKWH